MPPLTATYTSPSSPNPHTLSHPLPATSSNPTTSDRVAHLSALQSSIKHLQSDINAFLTQKMEEDKAAGAGVEKLEDENEKLEENYGEAVGED